MCIESAFNYVFYKKNSKLKIMKKMKELLTIFIL